MFAPSVCRVGFVGKVEEATDEVEEEKEKGETDEEEEEAELHAEENARARDVGPLACQECDGWCVRVCSGGDGS